MRIRKPESYETLLAEISRAQADRRTVIRAGAGAAASTAALGGGELARAEDATPDSADLTDVCVLTPELTAGPFYLEGDLVRKDITEGRAGVPLNLKITVLNPNTCSALENVAVDIWHCDALGYYSGVNATGPRAGDPIPEDIDTIREDNFLRGIQLTDDSGVAEFDTIYPGWYPGRAIHIHLRVHVDGTVDDGTDSYEGGQTVHTGQLFFDEAFNDLVFAEEPYAARATTRLANDDDNFLGDHDEEPGFMLNLAEREPGNPAEGILGTITIGVDPDRT